MLQSVLQVQLRGVCSLVNFNCGKKKTAAILMKCKYIYAKRIVGNFTFDFSSCLTNLFSLGSFVVVVQISLQKCRLL
jgi:hypothetical protein